MARQRSFFSHTGEPCLRRERLWALKVIENPHAALAHVSQWKMSGLRIGLVPTMGALHQGHISLVQQARSECDVVVATIFVNPTQFGPGEDFSRYPRTLESDLQALKEARTDLVFVPTAEHLYPPGSSTYVLPPDVSLPLEGQFRPHHFRGVSTIVLKLFNILPATVAYFGQKDYQQCLVIRRMVEDLNVPIRISICPTVRESDGLAMSSRNRYLAPPERIAALCLSKALRLAKDLYRSGAAVPEIEKQMNELLLSQGAERVDYARIVDRDHLKTLDSTAGPAIGLIAVHVGSTRLIDNELLEGPSA